MGQGGNDRILRFAQNQDWRRKIARLTASEVLDLLFTRYYFTFSAHGKNTVLAVCKANLSDIQGDFYGFRRAAKHPF